MNHVELSIPISRKYQEEILKNLYWIDPGFVSLSFDTSDERRLCYQYRDNTIAPKASLDRLKETANRLGRSLKRLPNKVIFESAVREVPSCAQPYEQLCQRGWLVRALDGAHTYHGLMSDLFHALDIQFRREAFALNVEECKFPTLISLPALARSGYLESFPHNANFVCHLPEQAETVEAFKAQVQTGNTTTPPVNADHALSPTVCYHYYHSQQNRVLKEGELLALTAASPCYRFEGKAMIGLRRLREFNMREIIFMGTPATVLARRDALIESQKHMLDFCQLRSTIQTASDPFFIDTYDKKRMFQVSFDLKFEVQAHLPADDAWLAIGSVNYHQDHFGKDFNIRLASGEPVHSCCLGFGIDRWCMAIFAQYGLEPCDWPLKLRELVETYQANR